MLSLNDLSESQLKCIVFIGAGEDSLIAASVGSGKTVMAYTGALEALKGRTVNRWLVLAPLLVATDTWALEYKRWEHLKHLKVAIACGDEHERLLAIEDRDAQIVVMNYENLQWLLDMYPKHPRKGDSLPFDGLICDEVDKLKEVSSKRFKAFRSRIGKFNKRIGLTGTLIPNKLTELWGQIYMVDGGQSFGRSFYKWRQQYFYPTDFNQYKWAPFPHTRDALLEKIADLTFRIEAENLPDVYIHPPHLLRLPESLRTSYRNLERDFFLMLDDSKYVEAANAAVLTGKLQQITAGFSYIETDEGRKTRWHTFEKITGWLNDLMLQDEQLLIVYNYRAELELLQATYPFIPHIGGGVSNAKARLHIANWNTGTIKYLAVHPASAGHGLNLQYSNAHRIAFLTLPWSGGLFHQVIGRLARRSNNATQVDVYTCLFSDTIDESVFRTVTGKLDEMTDFLDALDFAGKRIRA